MCSVTVAHLLFSLLCDTSRAKSKSKPDNSKPKSPPHLTVDYTNVRGLRGNFTDLEAFMLKNNPGIFALCETNLHDDIQDSDFQLPDYLPILERMLGICMALVFVKSNLRIDRETIIEDENESCVFSFGTSTFYYLHIFLYCLPSSSSCSVVEAVSSNLN